MCEGKSLVGTPRYASLNSHMGHEQSRRDDLETICYMLIFLYNGTLPWSGLRAENKQLKYLNIKKLKEEIPIADLCKDIPPVICDFLKYSRSLQFTERPDYQLWIDAFQKN